MGAKGHWSFIRRHITEDRIRKEKEWNLTKNRPEEKMAADMEKIRRQKEKESNRESAESLDNTSPPKAKRWFKSIEEEEDREAAKE